MLRELRVYFGEVESDELTARVGATVLLAGGLLALGVRLLVPGVHGGGVMGLLAVSASLFGLGALWFPWRRYGCRAQLAIPLFALGLFAAGGVLTHGSTVVYLSVLPLPFVFVGITQRPGTASALAPVAIASLLIADRFHFDARLDATLVFAVPMLVLVGEALAFAHMRRTRAERRLGRLLEAVRILARVDDPRQGAQLVASLSAELLEADAAVVMLADRPGSQRLLNRAFFGHPALAETTPLLVDALGPEVFDQHMPRFVSDPARVHALAPAASCVRAVVTVPLPGPDPAPAGVVIAMWTGPRRRLQPSACQAAELLSEEAGRMFRRLRESAELVHDAETDPLTDLANRRTFARALSTMQPGDALVLVDLDNFKRVNDEHGHQAGDETLRLLARDLRETARQVDCVARYGGEEFAVVLPEAGIEGAQAMLGRFRRLWTSHHPLTTFSAGIARHEPGRTSRDTLRSADAALYAAKAAGRDCDMIAAESGLEVVLP